MLLKDYLPNINKKFKNLNFSGLAFNSKEVKKNYIFIAIKGNRFDGNNYINDAIKNGAKIIIDFGTATTFDVINENNTFIGGSIAPGIDISANYLYKKAALLRNTTFRFPEKVIGKNTKTNL